MPRPRSPKNTAAEAAYQEVGQAIEAVQQELEQLRDEGAARAQDAARGAALIGGAGAPGLVSVGALGSLPLMALRRVVPAWLLAAISPEALEDRAKEAVETVAGAVR